MNSENTINIDDYLVYITFDNKQLKKFISIFNILRSYNDNTIIYFNKNDFYFKNKDRLDILMYKIIFYDIYYYYCKDDFDDFKIAVDLNVLHESINNLITYTGMCERKLSLCINKNSKDKLDIIVESCRNSVVSNVTASINLYDISLIKDIPPLQIYYNYEIEMKYNLFYDIINKLYKYNNLLNLELDPNKFILTTPKDDYNIAYEFNNLNINSNNHQKIICVSIDQNYLKNNETFKCNSTYDLRHIISLFNIILVNEVNIDIDNIDIRFDNNKPLYITYDIPQFSKCIFVIASK